jgi:deoxyribodipyrimidine photo-lyase
VATDKERVRLLNDKPIRAHAKYVLYWAQMSRRVAGNHGLAHAVGLANQMNLPVLYYEGLTCSYPYANDRFHTFILEGVPDTAAELKRRGIGYVFYLRQRQSDRNDVFYELARDAAAVVTDDYPTFVAAGHNARVPDRVECSYAVVDSSCVVPMGVFQKREYAAYTIRKKIQGLLPAFLRPVEVPAVARPFAPATPGFHTHVERPRIGELVAACDIDHTVPPSTAFRGGSRQASDRLRRFLDTNLRRYAREKNQPAAHATSNLSPYLHFGHISATEVAIAARHHASEHKLIADEFLEELIVRRELAFNFVHFEPRFTSLEALPDWVRKTLRKHDRDHRSIVYSLQELESAQTYDALWNATQKELLLRGKIHGYYRMYWGKKIIEWTGSHEDALDAMIYLHDRYALDGRDPNTYTNILWCFGLHDRPWQERPIFGQIRYMSFDGMKRKTDVHAYIAEINALEQTRQDALAMTT